jgi:hypothetical protein
MAINSESLRQTAPLSNNFSLGRSSIAQFFIEVDGLLIFFIF